MKGITTELLITIRRPTGTLFICMIRLECFRFNFLKGERFREENQIKNYKK